MQIDLSALSPKELLLLNSKIIKELKGRGISRTNNSPLGDYAEWLIAATLNLQLANNSVANFDATDTNGIRYQIKARSIPDINRRIQMSAIRGLSNQNFDFLLAIFFNEDYHVLKCLSLPWDFVKVNAKYTEHTNSHRLFIRPSSLVQHSEVRDLTELFLET